MTITSTSIDALITYDVPETPWTTDGGDPVIIDRITVQFNAATGTDDEEPHYFGVRVHGWRANADGTRDKRQKERITFIRGRSVTLAFAEDSLGIDYRADTAALLAATSTTTGSAE